MRETINNHIYDDHADAWWDENQFLYLLKAMVNPWRVPYFRQVLVRHYGQDLHQVHLLDIGSGGGVLAEEFAALGCQVTGIDISPGSVAAAQGHAAADGVSVTYGVASGTHLPFDAQVFEAVTCCDVLEHVRNWEQVISEAARVLVPGGLFLFDTINRTLKSRAVMIYALQVLPLTKLMPADTHIWQMFITPDEISSALQEGGMVLEDIQGSKLAKDPFTTLWNIQQQKSGKLTFAELGRRLELKLDADLSLNYLGYARKPLA